VARSVSATSLASACRTLECAGHESGTMLQTATLLLAASIMSMALGLMPMAAAVAASKSIATTAVATGDQEWEVAAVTTRSSPLAVSPVLGAIRQAATSVGCSCQLVALHLWSLFTGIDAIRDRIP